MRFNFTILQVVPRLNSGGAERTTLEITAAIVQAGGRALVATRGGRLGQDIEKAGGEIIQIPAHSKNPVTILINAQRLARIIRKRNVDLIHARSRAPAWSALLAAKDTGIAFVTTYHGAYKDTGPIKRWYNSSMLRSDRIIANSHFTASAIAERADIHPGKLRVVPRGADLDVFDPHKVSQERVNNLHTEWRIPAKKGAFRLLLPARLTPWKGHEIAIDAMIRLKSEMPSGIEPDLTLVFCGGAHGRRDFEQALRAKIESGGVSDMVYLVGECADMPAAYAWADAVVAPSIRPEAFGRVAVEAGAMARPVIASAHGGALETVIDGESGILVTPGDDNALANAIVRLRSMSDDERSIMGENGRARAISVYSANAMCDATLKIYSDLLNQGA